MIERTHKQILEKRILNESRRFIQVIYGPRQVGKTTMINQFTNEIKIPFHSVSADAVAAPGNLWIEQQWNIARLLLKNSGQREGILIIDEIQKIHNWSETVKKEWDSDTKSGTNLKVVLLGSSRLLIQQGLTESLAGRYETIYMGHWSFFEMNKAFDFDEEQYIWFGGYPGAAPLIEDENRWKHYIRESLIETSISKDILMLTRVDKPALMKRLFELGCLYSGQILSYSKIVGQLQDAGNTTTLAHYLQLLDTAGLLGGIEKYHGNTLHRRASSPKFQTYNTALISAQSELTISNIMLKPEIWGRWVESAIGAHILSQSLTSGYKVFYWRHRNEEIDFVLEHGKQIIGIEVKSGLSGKLRGMSSFQKQHNPDKLYLIGSNGIPITEFLKMNPIDLF